MGKYILRLFKTSVVSFCLAAAAVGAHAEGFTANHQKEVLDNGSTIICRYVPGSPLVTVQIHVLSGLSSEGEYASSGISHFLEHLLFKGTYEETSEEISRKVKAMGGIINASTGLDSAKYYITVPNKNFKEAMDLLADMVNELEFTESEMRTERDVVLKEIKLRNDDPISRRSRLLFSQAYREHAYKYPVLGYEELFKKLEREDILTYHDAVYTPDRMVVAIVGGVPPDIALGAAKEKFEGYQRNYPPRVDVFPEPKQLDERKTVFPAEITLGYMAIGFHTVSMYSPDLYALDVLSILVGEGNDSRLYKKLVKDKQLLYTVSSINYTPRYPGLFIITGVGDPEKLDQAGEEIFGIINGLKNSQIRDQEIKRAKNLVISAYLHSHERIGNIATSLANSQLLTGDPDFFEKYVNEIKKVDSEEVRKAASKYLTADNSTTVFLLPRDYLKKTETEEEKKAEAKTEEQVKSMTLENGLQIIVKRKGYLPLVSVTIAVPGGLKAENINNNGISNLTASVILKGTKERSEEEIIPVLEGMGGSIGTFSGMNSMGISMSLLAEDLDAGLDIFEDVARNAVFPEEEIAKQKKKIIAAIKEQETDIFDNGMIHLYKLLYGDHPYAMRSMGEVRTVEPISHDEITVFYREHFLPGGAVITVVGDVDVEKTTETIAERFGEWEGKGVPLLQKEVTPLAESRNEDIVMKKEQSLFLMGFQGVRVKDKRRYVLSVISSLLSGADGLLYYAAREEGITYASGAISVPEVDPGYFILYVATTKENIEKAKSVVLDILKKIKKGDITASEIGSSKNRLISQHARSLQTNRSVCMIMALDELYGLDFQNYERYSAEIDAVTKDDIQQCAGEIFNTDRGVTVIIRSEHPGSGT